MGLTPSIIGAQTKCPKEMFALPVLPGSDFFQNPVMQSFCGVQDFKARQDELNQMLVASEKFDKDLLTAESIKELNRLSNALRTKLLMCSQCNKNQDSFLKSDILPEGSYIIKDKNE